MNRKGYSFKKGEEVPAGECPECGCLCHQVEQPQRVEVFNLVLSFDLDPLDTPFQAAEFALDEINRLFQREPYGLAARLEQDPAAGPGLRLRISNT